MEYHRFVIKSFWRKAHHYQQLIEVIVAARNPLFHCWHSFWRKNGYVEALLALFVSFLCFLDESEKCAYDHAGKTYDHGGKIGNNDNRSARKEECRGPDSNRHGVYTPRDFKSLASTNSATPAALNNLNTISPAGQ